MPEEILSLIKTSNRENAEKKQLKKKSVWLIFTIGNQADGKNLYAIPADSVKEILRDATVFPLPFVPPYVNGVLNVVQKEIDVIWDANDSLSYNGLSQIINVSK